jgi:MoxR-like ATPase
VLLMGDTGSGKTMLGEAFASKLQVLYYSLPCDVSIDPTALFGKMQPTETAGRFKWQDGPVTQVVREGGVLNISEINFMPPKIAASLYPLLDGRRYVPLLGHEGEVVRAHPDLLVIADMNPGYRGTMELNAAFKNRFDHKIMWGYDEDVEKKLVNMPTLRDAAKRFRAMVGVEIQTPISTNMLMEFERFTMRATLGLDYAIENFVAAFEPDEKKSIKDILELNKGNFKSDIAFLRGENEGADDEDLDEAAFDFTEDV